MRHQIVLLLLAGILTACSSEPAAEVATETVSSTATTTPTVDYNSPDAWRGYNREDFPEKGWRSENGEIIVEHSGTEEEGYGGDIITREKFRDFDFQLEFRLSDTSNSGAFYLVREVAGSPIWHSAPEYQMLDDTTYLAIYDGLTDAQLTGANYDMHAQKVNYSKPIGEWNEARIRKEGNHVEHWLNGNMVVEYDLYSDDWKERFAASKFSEYPTYASVEEGHLGLQDHGHQVRFRNIRIERIGE